MRTVFVGRGYDVIFSLNTASVVHAPKVALFSLRQLLGTVFRERALRSASETICAKARENTVNFFSFFRSCRPESSTTAATAALRGATTTAGQGESVVLSGSGFRETTGSPLHLSKM